MQTQLTALEAEQAARSRRDDRLAGLGPAAATADRELSALPIVLSDLDGNPISLAALLAPGRSLLLAFTDPRCLSRPAILPDFASWQRSAALSVALISTGSAAANWEQVAPVGLAPVLLHRDLEVVNACGVEAAPAAMAVRALVAQIMRGLPLPDPLARCRHALARMAVRMTTHAFYGILSRRK